MSDADRSGESVSRDVQNVSALGPGSVAFGAMHGNVIYHPSDATEPTRARSNGSGDGRIRVLMLAANPRPDARLALDEEAREITEKLRLARDRDDFDLVTRWA